MKGASSYEWKKNKTFLSLFFHFREESIYKSHAVLEKHEKYGLVCIFWEKNLKNEKEKSNQLQSAKQTVKWRFSYLHLGRSVSCIKLLMKGDLNEQTLFSFKNKYETNWRNNLLHPEDTLDIKH